MSNVISLSRNPDTCCLFHAPQIRGVLPLWSALSSPLLTCLILPCFRVCHKVCHLQEAFRQHPSPLWTLVPLGSLSSITHLINISRNCFLNYLDSKPVSTETPLCALLIPGALITVALGLTFYLKVNSALCKRKKKKKRRNNHLNDEVIPTHHFQPWVPTGSGCSHCH